MQDLYFLGFSFFKFGDAGASSVEVFVGEISENLYCSVLSTPLLLAICLSQEVLLLFLKSRLHVSLLRTFALLSSSNCSKLTIDRGTLQTHLTCCHTQVCFMSIKNNSSEDKGTVLWWMNGKLLAAIFVIITVHYLYVEMSKYLQTNFVADLWKLRILNSMKN